MLGGVVVFSWGAGLDREDEEWAAAGGECLVVGRDREPVDDDVGGGGVEEWDAEDLPVGFEDAEVRGEAAADVVEDGDLGELDGDEAAGCAWDAVEEEGCVFVDAAKPCEGDGFVGCRDERVERRLPCPSEEPVCEQDGGLFHHRRSCEPAERADDLDGALVGGEPAGGLGSECDFVPGASVCHGVHRLE